MTRRILPFDRNIVPQETGFWCGPASAQIVLNSRGIHVPESELAREIGTHTGGTDHVGLIVQRTLNRRLPEAQYQVVQMPNDPPTPTQQSALFSNITRSIDAGYGLVVNWWAPPNNYPRGILGSPSPNYGRIGGLVKHYVTYMGYDSGDIKGVFVVDPGFAPFEGFFVSAHQAGTLIPPMGYAFSAAAKPAVTQGNPLEILISAMRNGVSRERYSALLPSVQEALVRCHCDNPNRISSWMAQVGHESNGLLWFRELWGPTPDQLTYEGRKELGNTIPGDGRRFLGRGPIQLTGRGHYQRLSDWAYDQKLVPARNFFTDNPEQLESDKYGFLGVIWYWTVARPTINTMSDHKDLEGVTRAINGGLNGLTDRRNRWNHCLSLGDSIMGILPKETITVTPPKEPAPEEISDEKQQVSVAELLNDVRDLKRALLEKVPSQSRYRHDNEDLWTTIEFIRNADAMIHEEYAERLALLGEPWYVQRITRNARRGDRIAYSVFERIDSKVLRELGISASQVEKEFNEAGKYETEYKD